MISFNEICLIFLISFHLVGQTDAFSLLSSLTRPAGGTPATPAPSGGAAAAGKQLDLNNNAFGSLIGGIFNQALSNIARPSNNGGINLGALTNPQTWANFGANPAGVPFQPQQPGGGDVSFPGNVVTTTRKTTTTKNSTAFTSIINLSDVPGWCWFRRALVGILLLI